MRISLCVLTLELGGGPPRVKRNQLQTSTDNKKASRKRKGDIPYTLPRLLGKANGDDILWGER